MSARPPWWVWAAAVGVGLYLAALPFLQYRFGAAHHAHAPEAGHEAAHRHDDHSHDRAHDAHARATP